MTDDVLVNVCNRLFDNRYDADEFYNTLKSRIRPAYKDIEYMLIKWLCDNYSDNYTLYVKLTQPNFQIDIIKVESKVDEEELRTEGVFVCEKCESSNTRYREIQTRSGDESFTKFVLCMDCKNTWTNWD